MQNKVLLVEDSDAMSTALSRILAEARFVVAMARDGEEALRLAHEDPPDLILLDLMLPKISGERVLQALKKDPVTVTIPVIVLSGLSRKNEEKLLHDGAEAYVQKSTLNLETHSRKLVTLIEQTLRHSKPREASTK